MRYSVSTVTWEQTQVSSAWSYSYGYPWESQRSALAGAGFDAQLLLWSSLRRTRFLVTLVSLALDTWLPWEFELKVSILWILFNLPADLSVPLWR